MAMVTNHGTAATMLIRDHRKGAVRCAATVDPEWSIDALKKRDASIVGMLLCHALLAQMYEKHEHLKGIIDEFEKLGLTCEKVEESAIVDKDGDPVSLGFGKPHEA